MKLKLILILCALFSLASFGLAQKDGAAAGPKTAQAKMPPRDPKTGKFIKSDKTKVAKAAQARDPKTGKFIKAAKSTKTMPPRDPKTGRFMKAKPAKTMPPRDPKTGKFIKQGAPAKKVAPKAAAG